MAKKHLPKLTNAIYRDIIIRSWMTEAAIKERAARPPYVPVGAHHYEDDEEQEEVSA